MSADPKQDPLVDEEDEEAAALTIDKTREQLEEEAIQRWKLFIYPKWAMAFVYTLFVFCIVNVVLTLDQWHGTHVWRKPFDLYPRNFRPGGWDDDQMRFASSILGLASAAFSFVLTPSADKFKFLFFMMFVASVLALVQFGIDYNAYDDARSLDECNQINDMKVNKYICDFQPYIATIIFDILSGFFGLTMSFFILYQALTGAVSRRIVFNEATSQWEKIVLMPDDPYYVAFPKIFKQQRPIFNLFVFFVALSFGVLLALSITQTSSDLYQGPDQAEPVFNSGRFTPVDLYLIQGDEAIRFGGWPKLNFDLRLSTNALAIVVLSFLIQWRNDGRTAQLWVLSLLFIAAILYIVSFAFDLSEFLDVRDAGCDYQEANGHRCEYKKYMALVIFDALCGFPLLMFSISNLFRFLNQARSPVNAIETREYGWWCFGENAEIKRQKQLAKSLMVE